MKIKIKKLYYKAIMQLNPFAHFMLFRYWFPYIQYMVLVWIFPSILEKYSGLNVFYKQENRDFNKRRQTYEGVKQQYPDKIPIICERDSKAKV